MSFSTPPLTNFIRSVPTCDFCATLECLWSIFQDGDTDQVVVIGQQGRPLGLVSLRRVVPYFLRTSMGSPGSLSGREVEDSLTWQQPILEIQPSLLEPLLMLPANSTLEQFWESLHSDQPMAWRGPPKVLPTIPMAVVESSGRFLGLLDALSFLRFLADAESTPPDVLGPQPRHLPVTPDVTSPGSSPLDSGSENATPSAWQTLMPLLEKLPIPLSVYGNNGEILNQNLAWRSLIGAAPLPVQEAAESIRKLSWLPPPAPGLSITPPPTTPETPEATPYRPSQVLINPDEGLDPEFPHPSYCHLGAQPNTYICVCPISGGQERVWQFVKQPLEGEWCPRGSTRVPAPGAESLWLVLAQDVTEQHLVAQELAAKNADLVQLNRLKDEFLACISHELKTPLTAVLGLSSLLKDQTLGQLNDRQVRYAQLIHQSGRHLMTVVNDILDLTRMETGQLDLSPDCVHLKTVCERAFEEAKRVYYHRESTHPSAEAPPEFTLQIEPGLETLVADELRVRQMLVHLLVNALKFTTSEDKIGLSVNRWEGWITFTVWDTGIGIPDDKQHLIFQKFQQLENPLTRQFEGAGLGLVLTQKLARLHGGDITFLSKDGIGSEFTLLLPPSPPPKDLNGSHSETGRCKSASRHLKHSRLVLIVEAVPRFIEDLTAQLTGLGYRVVIARSGPEALEKARQLQPRVIFLNPLLPLLSGWDVLTLLKTNPETDHLPVVVMTTRGEKQRADINRANGFLSLPVQQSALAECLAHLIDPDEVAAAGKQSVTILRLSPLKLKPREEKVREIPLLEAFFNLGETDALTQDIPQHLNQVFSDPRVLEADDLAQAELLARIWQPNVIILEHTDGLAEPREFLAQLIQYKTLAGLPIITLDLQTTQAANQFEELSVFPCLIFEPECSLESECMVSVLLQGIQVAMGLQEERQILVVDLTTVSDLQLGVTRNKVDALLPQALVHYMQMAGIRGIIGRSWSEVLQQLKYQAVDLLLIYLQYPLSPEVVFVLSSLSDLAIKPPILILDHSDAHHYLTPGSHLDGQQTGVAPLTRPQDDPIEPVVQTLSPQELMRQLPGIEIQVLPSSLSMAEVLVQIKKSLCDLP